MFLRVAYACLLRQRQESFLDWNNLSITIIWCEYCVSISPYEHLERTFSVVVIKSIPDEIAIVIKSPESLFSYSCYLVERDLKLLMLSIHISHWTSMLWPIDTCRLRFRAHQGHMLLNLTADKVLFFRPRPRPFYNQGQVFWKLVNANLGLNVN